MGKCKNCNTDVLDGQGLCDDCKKLEYNKTNSNESYLDSLLNSVVNIQPDINKESENNKHKRKRTLERIVNDKDDPMNPIKKNKNTNDNLEKQDEMEHKMKRKMTSTNELPDDMQFENEELNDDVDSSNQDDQSLDLNNIFDFMDMVGENSENNDGVSTSTSDENKNNVSSFNDPSEANVDDIFGINRNVNSDNSPIDDVDDDILSEDSDDFNELLNFLSEEDNIMPTEEQLDDSNEELHQKKVTEEDDIFSFDLFNNESENSSMELGSDLGNVFADTLAAVSSLDDPDEFGDLSSIVVPDLNQSDSEKKKKEKENKKSIFKELFSKSKEEDIINESSKDKKNKVKKATPQKNKNKPKKKTKKTSTKDKSENDKKGFLDFLKKNKNSKKNGKAKPSKSPKSNKTPKVKTPKNVEEVEIDKGKINKFAAMFVFTVFGIFAAVVIFGTNIVSYSTSISNATKEFERNRYNYAYKAIHGIEIKEKDIELYDKVMTVMFVNKQLNSYNNFYSNKAYPQALDSLLKGLKRYDKYITLAKELGIESDLNYVRKQILTELKKSYNISEKEAVSIIQSEDQTDYSIKLYNVVIENKQVEEKGTE